MKRFFLVLVYSVVATIFAIKSADALVRAADLPFLDDRTHAVGFLFLWMILGVLVLVGSFVAILVHERRNECGLGTKRKELREIHPSDLEG